MGLSKSGISTLIGVIDSMPIGSIVVPFWDYLMGF